MSARLSRLLGFVLVLVSIALLMGPGRASADTERDEPDRDEPDRDDPDRDDPDRDNPDRDNPEWGLDEASRVLRLGWVAHRLRGERDEARELYHNVLTRSPAGAEGADLRARAAIGLGMMAREDEELDQARRWFEHATRVSETSPRWVRNASQLLATVALKTEESAEERVIGEMGQRVGQLEREHDELTNEVAIRGEELRRKDELIRRLELALEAQNPGRRPRRSLSTTEASRLMESMVQDQQRSEAVRRYFLDSALDAVRGNYQAGRYLTAFNEAKKVLDMDPQNREAQDYKNRCRSMLTAMTADREMSEQNGEERKSVRARGFAVEVMKSSLADGRRLYSKGKIGAACRALQRVLKEYAWCPAPLSDEEIATYVQPAERLLRRCFDEGGFGAEAQELQGREDALMLGVQAAFRRLFDHEVALEEVRSELERFKKNDPQKGLLLARHEVERLTREALEASRSGITNDAILAFTDILILLEWFPDLDTEGKLRDDMEERLAALQVATGPDSDEVDSDEVDSDEVDSDEVDSDATDDDEPADR